MNTLTRILAIVSMNAIKSAWLSTANGGVELDLPASTVNGSAQIHLVKAKK